MAGALAATVTLAGAETTPSSRVTTTLAGPLLLSEGTTSHGTWMLIWPPLTNCTGAATLLTVTLTPLSVVESGTVPEAAMFEARLDPKIETSEPGATAWLVVAPAVLVMPEALTAGGGVWADWAEAAMAAKSRKAGA